MRIRTIDCHYAGQEQVAAAYLLIDGDEAAFIETNTSFAVPRLLDALAEEGLTPAQVRWVVITHIHLDHAGGAGQLMAACPEATLLAHPKAAPHAVDPTRIVAGATAVYGAESFAELYGEILPIPAERVQALDDGAEVPFGRGTLRFLHTRGHANHHFVVVVGDAVFTGDAFGIAYPALQTNGVFAFPSTSPTDFDPAAAHAAVDQIVSEGERAFPTHYGEQTELETIAAQLHAMLDAHTAVLDEADRQGLEGEELDAFCQERIRADFDAHVARHGLTGHPRLDLLELDIDLNAQGVAFALQKRRFKRRKAGTKPSEG